MMAQFHSWLGSWSGNQRLWLTPDSEELGSPVRAEVSKIINDKFLQLEYGWEMESEPQSGTIILPANIGEEEAHAVWLDSWHTRHDMMVCIVSRAEGMISMMGTYPAPPDDDWGWRLEISQKTNNELGLQMYNISPECEECLAVEMELARQV